MPHLDIINDTKLIDSENLPKVLVKELQEYIEPLYPTLFAAWENDIQNATIRLKSLKQLIKYFETNLGQTMITTMLIRYHLQMYVGFVLENIKKSIEEDLQEIECSLNANKEIEFVYTNVMDENLNIMRDMVSNKSKYKKKSNELFQATNQDSEGTINIYAEIRENDMQVHQLKTKEETDKWLSLVAETLTSLDEWTADLFDMICFFWSSQEKDEFGYIDFHSDDALRFKHGNAFMNTNFEKRERERFDIMRRVAALTNIWVSLRDDKIKIIGDNDRQENAEYDFSEFKRMFEISSVKIANDKRTGESKGIYALTIKPSPLLMEYIADGRYTLGAMDLKIFEYSHFRQRDHKRLARYFSYLWKAMMTNSTMTTHKIPVQTLLDAIDLPKGYSGSEIRERLENVLDDLQRDKIIQSWSYITSVDESIVGKKGWLKNYWGKLTLNITPPTRILVENQKELTAPPKLVREKDSEQLVLVMDEYGEKNIEDVVLSVEEVVPTYETVQEIAEYVRKILITNKDKSIRKIALEIGISHPTLSKWLSEESPKTIKKSLEKARKWINERESK